MMNKIHNLLGYLKINLYLCRKIFDMSKKTYFQYTPPVKTAWDDLPINEKADIMKSCVRNRIISPQDIRTAYNNYAAGRNILEGIPDYQANAIEFGNFLAGGGRKDNREKVVVHQPHYAYDDNGRKIDDTLYYNVDVTMPEVTIIPDSRKSPAQRNEDERFRQRVNRNYAEQQARDYTTRQTIAAQKKWENSPQKKALDLGIAAAQGIGMASDALSPFFRGIPVYSGLKGVQALDRAISTNELADYADAALWLSPILTVAGKKIYDAAKPAVQRAFQKGTPAAEWAESSSMSNNDGIPWTVQEAKEASKYAGKFFKEDVLPRLQLSRGEVDNALFTQNSPFLGRFSLTPKPANIPGETSSVILEKNGIPYTVEINKNDLASFDDKLNTIIHEMREDMTFHHKGLYNKDLQLAMKHWQEFKEVRKSGNLYKAYKLMKRHKEEFDKLENAYNNAFLTPKERSLIESAYKVPRNPVIKESAKLNEKVAENTRFRAKISRNHGGVTGKELDAEIDNLSDEELMDVLSDGKSYGQDYRKYIEEHPKQRTQMIANIKKALKTVGVFAGGAEILPDLLVTEDGIQPL